MSYCMYVHMCVHAFVCAHVYVCVYVYTEMYHGCGQRLMVGIFLKIILHLMK